MWYNTPVNIHVNDGKIELRARKCIFMGYGVNVKRYRMWCEGSKRIITSRDVVLDENNMLVSSVEKPLNDDVNNPSDAQEEVQPPNNEEEKYDDDVQQRSPHLSTKGKRGRSWLQKGTLKSVIMLQMLSTLLVISKGLMNQVRTRRQWPQMTQASG